MAYQITHQGRSPEHRLTEFTCDTRADLDSLPVSPEVAPGSNALVIEDSSVHVLSPAQNKYIEI